MKPINSGLFSTIKNEFARLGNYHGTADALLSMVLPVSETIDRFEKENDELIEKSKTAARKKQEIEDEKKTGGTGVKRFIVKRRRAPNNGFRGIP